MFDFGNRPGAPDLFESTPRSQVERRSHWRSDPEPKLSLMDSSLKFLAISRPFQYLM